MLPVAGKPLIQYAVDEAAVSGIETVIVITRDHKSLIQEHFPPDPALESFLRWRKSRKSPDSFQPMRQTVNLQYVHQTCPLGLSVSLMLFPALGRWWETNLLSFCFRM